MNPFQDFPQATGELLVTLLDEHGKVKEQHRIKNLITTAGKTFIAARIVGAPTAMSHMAIGSGTTAAAIGDTALGGELARVAMASSTSASNVVTNAAVFGPGVGTGSVTEAGTLNASSAGTLLNRVVFPVVNKAASDTLQVNWTITIS